MEVRFGILILATFMFLNTNTQHDTHKPSGFGVNFHQSMESTKKYNRAQAKKNASWRKAYELYTNHIVRNLSISDEPKIPKIIHQIWVGPRPFPDKCKILQETWLKHHPDWEYILWTNEKINALGLTNKKRYEAAQNYGEKADIARYEILYKFGGLYVDTDFECLQPFDALHHCCDFFAGVDFKVRYFFVFNGLIASRPGHPVLKQCINSISKQATHNYTTKGIIERTGPLLLTKHIKQYMQHAKDSFVLFPVTYFYPWPNFYMHQKEREKIEAWFKPESFAIHHWHVSWAKKSVLLN